MNDIPTLCNTEASILLHDSDFLTGKYSNTNRWVIYSIKNIGNRQIVSHVSVIIGASKRCTDFGDIVAEC